MLITLRAIRSLSGLASGTEVALVNEVLRLMLGSFGPLQVVGAPGVAFSVAMAPSRGSFDLQLT
ncbi:MAG: hypothetical protein NTY67_14730 [Cyanobacteria bacterium]|nr:hypothetical protein [Cyanobacteriota bacterium]